ncbi:MAG: lycopene cyclase domain-containing protein, partial [Mycobacterium sp.]
MMGLGYTVPAVVAVLAVCVLEFALLHTGLFRRPAY